MLLGKLSIIAITALLACPTLEHECQAARCDSFKRVEEALEQFGPDERLLMRRAQIHASLVEYARKRILECQEQRTFAALQATLNELSPWLTSLPEAAKAREDAASALPAAKEQAAIGDGLFAASNPRGALPAYEQALQTCADYLPAKEGRSKAAKALALNSRKRRAAAVAAFLWAFLVCFGAWAWFSKHWLPEWREFRSLTEFANSPKGASEEAASVYRGYMDSHSRGFWHAISTARLSAFEEKSYSNFMARASLAGERMDWAGAVSAYQSALQMRVGDAAAMDRAADCRSQKESPDEPFLNLLSSVGRDIPKVRRLPKLLNKSKNCRAKGLRVRIRKCMSPTHLLRQNDWKPCRQRRKPDCTCMWPLLPLIQNVARQT
jgi:hypothetical protein